MSQPVELTVRSQLSKISKDLSDISKNFEAASSSIKNLSEQLDEEIEKKAKKTKTGLEVMGSLMKRTLKGLKDDFKTLTSLGAAAGALKLSTTMKGSISDTLALSNAVQKLNGIFKIGRNEQSKFVGDLTKGLGDVGLSSESAANALQGLSQTQVRGQGNLIEYSKTAGMLASASGQIGQEGAIAQGLAGVVQARGRNVNDPHEMQAIAESVSRAHEATGMGASEILANMQSIFSTMNDSFKAKMTPQALAQLTAVSSAGGEGGASFLKEYLGSNKYTRAGLDAQGFGQLFSDKGLNQGALRGLVGKARTMGGGDVNAGFEAMGLSAEQAKGLKMLYDQLDAVNKAAKEVATSTRTVADSFNDAKTLSESFRGNFDKVKSLFAKPIGAAAGGLTDLFKGSQKSTAGALAVVGGSAVAAGFLAKIGLGGIGSALGLKNAQEQILESKGESIQKVHVTNFSEVKGGLGGSGVAGAAASAAGTIGLAGAGIGAAALLTLGIPELFQKMMGKKGEPDFISSFIDAIKKVATEGAKPDWAPGTGPRQTVNVHVKTYVDKNGHQTQPPASRGHSQSGVRR